MQNQRFKNSLNTTAPQANMCSNNGASDDVNAQAISCPQTRVIILGAQTLLHAPWVEGVEIIGSRIRCEIIRMDACFGCPKWMKCVSRPAHSSSSTLVGVCALDFQTDRCFFSVSGILCVHRALHFWGLQARLALVARRSGLNLDSCTLRFHQAFSNSAPNGFQLPSFVGFSEVFHFNHLEGLVHRRVIVRPTSLFS